MQIVCYAVNTYYVWINMRNGSYHFPENMERFLRIVQNHCA